MKVLHVIDALGVGGGAEHSLAAVLPLLRERGIENSVACLIPRVGGLQERLGDEGFEVEVLPGAGRLAQVRSLRSKISNERPDVVHATLYNSCLTARFASIGLSAARIDSLVNTSYDPVRTSQLDVARWKLRVARSIDAATARVLGGHFHAVTAAVREEAVAVLGVAPDRVSIVPRGRSSADLGPRTKARRQTVRARLGVADERPVVLNVGRQDAQKAQDVLIRAFAVTLRRVPDAVLLIAGREGDASHTVEQALAETGVGESVQLLGHRSDVADLLAACDIFAFPSMYEGAAGAILEAMALSAPVIGSDSSAISEVLGDGEYGVVVRRGDVDALGAAMADLLGDERRRHELGARGRARFDECYELDRVADQMAELYERVASQRLVRSK